MVPDKSFAEEILQANDCLKGEIEELASKVSTYIMKIGDLNNTVSNKKKPRRKAGPNFQNQHISRNIFLWHQKMDFKYRRQG